MPIACRRRSRETSALQPQSATDCEHPVSSAVVFGSDPVGKRGYFARQAILLCKCTSVCVAQGGTPPLQPQWSNFGRQSNGCSSTQRA
eukprot:2977564-Amphidinium_carterae.1